LGYEFLLNQQDGLNAPGRSGQYDILRNRSGKVAVMAETTMRFNLEYRIAKTEVRNYRPLTPIYEAIHNSIHAVSSYEQGTGRIKIVVTREPTLDTRRLGPISDVTVEDNGIGFNSENFDAFREVDTPHKAGIGGKGVGRLTWLVAFSKAEIESNYREGQFLRRRMFQFSLPAGIVGEIDALAPDAVAPRTVIRLRGFRSPWSRAATLDPERVERSILEHFAVRLLSDSAPHIELEDGDRYFDLNADFRRLYDANSIRLPFDVLGNRLNLIGVRLRDAQRSGHTLVFVAHGREVRSEGTGIEGLPLRLEDERGRFTFVGFVEGEVLDRRVRDERDSFSIVEAPADESDGQSVLLPDVTWRDIRQGAQSQVRMALAPWIEEIDRVKRERVEAFVREVEPHYGPVLRDVESLLPKIPVDASPLQMDEVLYRHTAELRIRASVEVDRLLSEMRGESLPDPAKYRERLAETVRRASESSYAELARYVSHRKVILDLFDQAMRIRDGDVRPSKEEVLHGLIFPLRASGEDADLYANNLWMIDERLAFNFKLYSDVMFKNMAVLSSESRQEPDILIFDKPFILSEDDVPLQHIIIVEFKRPGRRDYSSPVEQVYEYLEKVRASKINARDGRPIRLRAGDVPATLYVIADLNETLRKAAINANLLPTPDGEGYYGYHGFHNAYVEVFNYDKILGDAGKRNHAFFHALGLPPKAAI
jgi:hypothetical protein